MLIEHMMIWATSPQSFLHNIFCVDGLRTLDNESTTGDESVPLNASLSSSKDLYIGDYLLTKAANIERYRIKTPADESMGINYYYPV